MVPVPPGRSSDAGQTRGGKKKKKGPRDWYPDFTANVDESFCISVHSALQSLVQDGEQAELSFPSSYDNSQRRYIHTMAEKYGLFSKSAGGKGEDRFVHVASVKKNAAMEKVSLRLHSMLLNPETVTWFPPVIKQYMENYPAPSIEKEGAADPWGAKKVTFLASPPKAHRSRGAMFTPLPRRGSQEGPKIVRTPPVEATRLPVYEYREQILKLVEENQIVVLSADTGCGKSTQIPQFLLDDALARGRSNKTRIICTQPRRISAISLADRVTRERPGQSPKEVGHAIRFDSSFDAKKSKLIFCTTGTLLNWLYSDPCSRGFSHIILDEVHERDQFTDFLLILIKTSILKQRPDLKVILMSATIQVEKFAQYFHPEFQPPVLQMVGGTNFPVSTLFLEDILALLEIDRTSSLPVVNSSQFGPVGDGSGCQLGGMAANNELVCSLCGSAGFEDEVAFGTHVATCFGERGADFEAPLTPEPGVAPVAVPVSAMGDVLQATLSGISDKAKRALLVSYTKRQDALYEDQAVDYDLLLQLLFIVNSMFPLDQDGKGAILVFLPGWQEISYMERALLKSPATSATYEIALLHSRLSPQEQRRAFMTPPPGKRKLVLTTNIAETSLTIEDVVFVVDCGKSKQTHALASSSTSSFVMGLQTTWIARANCVQRTGRAGRVRAGVCFRLFSKARYETAMKEFMPPQLLTTPLEELLLQIKLLQMDVKLNISSAKAFLLEAMDAPSEASIDASLQRLQGMNALNKTKKGNQVLTLLGWYLAHLCSGGVSVQMAKLLLWGHMFGCFDAILTTSCTLSGYRDPFISFLGMPKEGKREVDAAKKAFARHGLPPGLVLQSDHYGLYKALEAFLEVRSSSMTTGAFCMKYKMDRQTLHQLSAIYKQLKHDLGSMGLSITTQLVPTPLPTTPATMESVAQYLMALSVGMYPNALFARSGAVKPTWTTKEKVKVKMDGASIVALPSAASKKKRKRGHDETAGVHEWLLYHEMVQSGSIRIAKYGTKLPSHLLEALFLGSVETQVIEEQKTVAAKGEPAVPSTWLLVLDDWLTFEIDDATEARWLALLRERLHAAFVRHLERLHAGSKPGGRKALSEPDQKLRDHDVELVQAFISWVSSDMGCGSKRKP
uniref:Uncharacterized protein n=1 Tax=Hyaloperonospora arabidopsidis (strain Emoy2) TaxID=559515 RepID=M4B2F4_HYAAE